MNYQIEIKQIVDFPRVRIYRDFIRTLITEKGIRTSGSSFLFYYIVLCSYANYRISYRRLESITYTVGPGEWICTVSDLQEWFRCRFQHQAISILNQLEQQNYISYTMLGNRKLIKFKITGWKKDNTALDYSCPCKKNDGFFFFPIAKVHELIGMGKCSEMDILLDLWIHAIYNDPSTRVLYCTTVQYLQTSFRSKRTAHEKPMEITDCQWKRDQSHKSKWWCLHAVRKFFCTKKCFYPA